MRKAHSHTWFSNVHSETQKLRRQNANVLRLRSARCLFSHVIVQFPNSRHMYALRTYFLVLSVTRPSPSLGQVLVGTLNHATCNVYSPKAFETLIHENVTHIVFFIVSEIYFLFVLSKSSIQSERTCQNVQGLRNW